VRDNAVFTKAWVNEGAKDTTRDTRSHIQESASLLCSSVILVGCTGRIRNVCVMSGLVLVTNE
jgi:hypothetical protein